MSSSPSSSSSRKRRSSSERRAQKERIAKLHAGVSVDLEDGPETKAGKTAKLRYKAPTKDGTFVLQTLYILLTGKTEALLTFTSATSADKKTLAGLDDIVKSIAVSG